MFPWVRTKFGVINFVFKSNRSSPSKDNTMQLKSEENSIKLNIINSEESVLITDVPESITVSELVDMAVSHFYSTDNVEPSISYKLISVSKRTSLDSSMSVKECTLQSHDELLLVEKKKSPPIPASTRKSTKSPSKRQILEATKDIEVKHMKPGVAAHSAIVTTDIALRKVFISLIEVSSKILSAREDSDKIYEMIAQNYQSKLHVIPDKNLVKKFTSMGFSEQQVIIALKLKRNNTTESLEWLLDANNKCLDYASIVTYLDDNENMAAMTSSNSSLSLYEKVQILLDDNKRRECLEYTIDLELVNNFKELGFTEKEVKNALKITNNDNVCALHNLVSGRKAGIENFNSGLESDHPILKALLNNSVIMLGLGNPKLLLAMLGILDSSNNHCSMWMQDSEISPIISTILRVYQSEKHILGVNKYFEQNQNPIGFSNPVVTL